MMNHLLSCIERAAVFAVCIAVCNIIVVGEHIGAKSFVLWFFVVFVISIFFTKNSEE